MDITVKSERIQELEVIVDELYNKEVLPIYLKKYGAGILQIMDREIQEMKQYLIYEYVMQCIKEPEVDTEYLN